ncbi:MAG: hypothetical protein U9R54_06400, partial [Bacteroidota bacterium]|nr:hypothetical protein [Bacteroidota bacterium]
MKIFINVIVILLISGFVSAQEIVTIEQCWQNAYNNMPTMKQKYSLQKLDSLEQSILKTNYLPVINANAQASWQSDVVGIDIESP